MGTPVPFLPGLFSSERDNLFKGAMDSLPDGVSIADRERRITYWNDAAEYLTGYRANEVIGKHCSDNFLTHGEDGGCLLCEGVCPLRRTIEDGRMRRAEVYFRHRAGHRVPVEVRVAPIRGTGNEVVGVIELFNDKRISTYIPASRRGAIE